MGGPGVAPAGGGSAPPPPAAMVPLLVIAAAAGQPVDVLAEALRHLAAVPEGASRLVAAVGLVLQVAGLVGPADPWAQR
eukprot:12649022-Alexandrium_andersonii.AAC.1